MLVWRGVFWDLRWASVGVALQAASRGPSWHGTRRGVDRDSSCTVIALLLAHKLIVQTVVARSGALCSAYLSCVSMKSKCHGIDSGGRTRPRTPIAGARLENRPHDLALCSLPRFRPLPSNRSPLPARLPVFIAVTPQHPVIPARGSRGSAISRFMIWPFRPCLVLCPSPHSLELVAGLSGGTWRPHA